MKHCTVCGRARNDRERPKACPYCVTEALRRVRRGATPAAVISRLKIERAALERAAIAKQGMSLDEYCLVVRVERLAIPSRQLRRSAGNSGYRTDSERHRAARLKVSPRKRKAIARMGGRVRSNPERDAAIRAGYAAGVSVKHLAMEYGVGPSGVYKIIRREAQ